MPTSTLKKQQNASETNLESESSQKLLFHLLEKIDKLDTNFDDRIDKLDAKLDGRIDKLDAKLDDRIDQLDTKLDFQTDKLNTKIDSRFLWTIGIMFTGFIGMIAIILSKI